jgi:drug/metabolite transporter (DMT)-like permease
MLALLLHYILEPTYLPNSSDWIVLVALGAGPLGAAFYFWDFAIKKGNPQQIGLLSFLTPLLSTTALIIVTGRELSLALALAALLIVLGALLGRTGSSSKLEQ